MRAIAKLLAGVVVLTGAATLACAQDAPATKTYTTPAEVQAMIAAKKAGPLAQLGTYLANMEYRAAGGPAGGGAVHKTQAELIYFISGTGSIKVGGSLVNAKDSGGENITGTDIAGGTDEAVTPGTVVLIPEGTPHAFTVINGPLVDMSIKLPRGPAKPAP
jgi:mannose-6-phosphate isomerase-like protein (cupin superfamily)